MPAGDVEVTLAVILREDLVEELERLDRGLRAARFLARTGRTAEIRTAARLRIAYFLNRLAVAA